MANGPMTKESKSMNDPSRRIDRYGSLSIALHWLMLVLIIGVYTCIDLVDFFAEGSNAEEFLKTWHFTLGLSILALVVLRVIVNVTSKVPEIQPVPPNWQKKAGNLMHLALYALMFCMPVAGWLILSAEGTPIPFFGLHLPALIGVNEGTADLVQGFHETLGTLGYFLIGLHAVAGLFHHYVMRDTTLLRMLPERK